MDKNQIRQENKLRRMRLQKSEIDEMSRMASKHFLKSDIYKNCKTLMLYMPIKNEIDTAWIIKAARADGKRSVFPVTKGGVITPMYADKSSEFCVGAFSVPEPSGGNVAQKEDIDVVLVPGVAFDRAGVRVGFGKGCYDRFFKNMSATRVGFCYDFQICGKILPDKYDINMDYIVSENGIFKC